MKTAEQKAQLFIDTVLKSRSIGLHNILPKIVELIKEQDRDTRHQSVEELRAATAEMLPLRELIGYLCEEQPAFAEDLLNGHGLLESFDGHFVAWDEIIEACGNGMEGYGDSPVELINRIINERDALKEEIAVIQKAGYSDNSVIEQARQEGRANHQPHKRNGGRDGSP